MEGRKAAGGVAAVKGVVKKDKVGHRLVRDGVCLFFLLFFFGGAERG